MFGQMAEVKQMVMEEMRDRVSNWPVKDSGWTESDVWNAIKSKEQQ